MHNDFHDTVPVMSRHAAERLTVASWPFEAQPMAAEAATEVAELPAEHEYDFPRRSLADRVAAARFWTLYLIAAVGAAAFLVANLPLT
jgi:hypothetical protein